MWKGEYWANTSLSGPVALCRDDPTVDMDWEMGSPDPSIPPDNFSVRLTRTLEFTAGSYIFHMRHDDGARLYIDNVLKIDAWTTCCVWETLQVQLAAGPHNIRVEMFESGGAAHIGLWWEPAIINGWRGEYYNRETLEKYYSSTGDLLTGNPAIIRDDPAINFEWQGNSPDPMIIPDHFSVRWTRWLTFNAGDYRFDVFHDDGARLYIDNVLVGEWWCTGCRQTDSVTRSLTTAAHEIKLEMYDSGGWASAVFSYTSLQPNGDKIYLPLVSRAAPSPGSFNKTAPADGATDQPTGPVLSWSASSGANSYEYCLDIYNDNVCNGTWTSTGTSTSAGLGGLPLSATIYWQVRAVNAAGLTYADGGAWWSFTITSSPSLGIVNGDFESGTSGWTEYSTHGWPIIMTSFPGGVTARSGSYAAWLGGDYSDISYVQQPVTISASAPYLVYWHWIASEDICGFDFAGVVVNGIVVDVYDLCSSANTNGWVKHSVNLGAYAGQSVLLQIPRRNGFVAKQQSLRG